jgi:hypothetical protein
MCYIDGQKNKYSVLNECSRMLKYNIYNIIQAAEKSSLNEIRYNADTIIFYINYSYSGIK